MPPRKAAPRKAAPRKRAATKRAPDADAPTLIPVVINGQTVGQVRPNPRVPAWTLMKFAEAASGGLGSDDPAGLLVMLRVVRRAVHPDDVAELERLLDEHEPTGEELLSLVGDFINGETGRPTRRPSDSSAGPPDTGRTSLADSSLPATVRRGDNGELVAIVDFTSARTG
jgi:hypothetical protein